MTETETVTCTLSPVVQVDGGFVGDQARGPCGQPAVAQVASICRHEHGEVYPVCAEHEPWLRNVTDQVVPECLPCREAGHRCPLAVEWRAL